MSDCFPEKDYKSGIYSRNTLCPERLEVNFFLLIVELPATDVIRLTSKCNRVNFVAD